MYSVSNLSAQNSELDDIQTWTLSFSIALSFNYFFSFIQNKWKQEQIQKSFFLFIWKESKWEFPVLSNQICIRICFEAKVKFGASWQFFLGSEDNRLQLEKSIEGFETLLSWDSYYLASKTKKT